MLCCNVAVVVVAAAAAVVVVVTERQIHPFIPSRDDIALSLSDMEEVDWTVYVSLDTPEGKSVLPCPTQPTS